MRVGDDENLHSNPNQYQKCCSLFFLTKKKELYLVIKGFATLISFVHRLECHCGSLFDSEEENSPHLTLNVLTVRLPYRKQCT